MKTTTFLALAAAAKLAAAHTTFQEIIVNGKSQGTTGVRGTANGNNPILSDASSLASDLMICNGGAKVTGQVKVAGGDKLSLQWHHNNPSSGAGDADEPIAASHNGPVLVWIAKASTEGKGNAWVKISEDGLNGGKWGVDHFRANAGKVDITLPDLAAGDYLIRPEIIALHEGDRPGKTQLYNGCGQLTVTSNGKLSITNGANIQSVYKTDDAGILYNMYGGSTTYKIPGPAVNAGFSSGSGSSAPAATPKPAAPAPTKAAAPAAPKPTTLATVVKTTQAAAPSKAPAAGSVAKWAQCGGIGYTGATGCVSGSTCQKQNDYYYQCL